MSDFKKEGSEIIEDLISLQKDASEGLGDLWRFVTKVFPNKIASELNPLETEIHKFIALYEAREYLIRKNLVALYKRYKHLADFNLIVKDREAELKKLLDKNKNEQRRIHDEIMARKYNVDPKLLIQFLDINLDFDAVKAKYQELSKKPTIESDTVMHENLIAALTRVVHT